MDSISNKGLELEDVLVFVGATANSLRYKALAENTWRSYKRGLRRWIAFANMRGISALHPDIDSLTDCIEHYNETGVTASAIDTMCTAVSTVFSWRTGERLGQKAQVTSLIKALYNTNKIIPQQRYFFEPELLLSVVERDNGNASIRIRLRRVATLLVMCHAMRFTEMEGILKREINYDPARGEMALMIILKTDQRRKRRIVIGEIEERPEVFVVRAIRETMERGGAATAELFSIEEGTSSRKLSASQISLLVKEVMREANIPELVTPYNAKHVGLTKAWEVGTIKDQLRDVARWSKNSEQFRRRYRVGESKKNIIKLKIGGDQEGNRVVKKRRRRERA
jgi:site-specific recombinase XerD